MNHVIPWVTTIWDKRPRYESPVSWENCKNFHLQYIQGPTLEELKEELEKAYQFHKDKYILLYAWNEFDEGDLLHQIGQKRVP